MNGRKMFHWKVPVQFSTGTVRDVDVHAFWSPNKTGTREAIKVAAMVLASGQTKTSCTPVGEAVLVEDELEALLAVSPSE